MKKITLTLIILFLGFITGFGQTIYDWDNAAPDGNWRQGAAGIRWNPGGLWDNPPNGQILRFNNDHELNMTNNVSNYQLHGIIFGDANNMLSPRSLNGNDITLEDYSGTDSSIKNNSQATHTVNLNITLQNRDVQLNPINGNLIFNGTINNAGKYVKIFGNNLKTITFNGSISGSGGFSVEQNSIVYFNTPNTYTGVTNLTAGTIHLGANDIINDTSKLSINGGTFSTGETIGYSDQLGALIIANSGTIHLGIGSHQLKFADSHNENWATFQNLTIKGWNNGGKIFVGTNSNGLTNNQLSQIQFEGFPIGAKILTTGEVVPAIANIGDIIITEIMADPTVVSDIDGEWFELYNTTNTDINIQGWIISDGGTTSHTHIINHSVIVPANNYILLAKNGDSATNGGLPSAAYDYDAITFANTSDTVSISLGILVIDSVSYDNGDTFPKTAGKSMTLRTTKFTDILNDSGYNWCDGVSVYGDGDFGTPGTANDNCKCNNLEVITWDTVSGIKAWRNESGAIVSPTTENNIKIKKSYNTNTIGNSIEACRCKVMSGGTLTITANKYLKVIGDIEISAASASITVKNTGAVVQVNDDATVTGSGTFKVNVTTTPLLDTDRFTYFSSPSTGNNLDVFSWANLAYMWSFDGTTQNWHYEASPASVAMDAAQGFAVQDNNTSDTTNGDQETTIFNGAFNNGVFSQPMYYQVAGAPDPSDSSSALVGNPYPSAIDSDKLFTANPQLAGIYIWNHDSPLGNNYGDWANNDYIVCSAGNACTSAPSGGPNATHNGYIATGQGFFATANVANPADLVFNNAMRVAGNNDQFHRTPSEDRMWINLTDSTIGYYSQTLFRFTSNGNENLNNQYDALRLGSNYGLSFYSITHDTNDKLAIEDRGLFADDITIPVGYTVNNPAVTQLTFSIDHFQNLEGVNVYLKDNLLNITHDLKLADYTFGISTTGEVNDRFELLFSRNALATTNFEVSKDRLVVSNQGNSQIKVNMLDGSVISNLKAYNTLGKLVINTYANSNSFVINTTLKRGQIVFIKATLENGQILKKKFIKL